MRSWNILGLVAIASALMLPLAGCGSAPDNNPPADGGRLEGDGVTAVHSGPRAETATRPTARARSAEVRRIADELEGLPIDEFYEQSYRQIMRRSPEYLTALGLSDAFGVRDDELDDVSDDYALETYDLKEAILEVLRSYDRDTLTADQTLTYDVYEWYLDNEVRGREFMYHRYPVHHFLGSHHDTLVRLFTEYHVVADADAARDYVTRLGQIDRQVSQLLDGLARRQAMGIVAPRFILQMARDRIEADLSLVDGGMSSIRVEELPLYTVFDEQLVELDDMSAADKDALRAEARRALEESFVPAYASLLERIDELESVATNEAGASSLPRGPEYYRWALHSQTTTSSSPDEIHELGLAEVARIHAEMQAVFQELGYPQGATLGENMSRAIRESGGYDLSTAEGRDDYLRAFEEIIAEVDGSLDPMFDIRPRAALEVVGGDQGGFYVPAAMDGSRPGAFHVGLAGGYAPRFNMASLAYHEAIPGHHFQIAIAQELDLPALRKDMSFTAYAEGWALYAERLGYEMGLYDDDPYGNLGRLQFELLRAVRLVVDTGIHAKSWSRDDAREYMAAALGDSEGRWAHEVERYVVMPGQATAYKIGMLKMLELRAVAESSLGDDFDLKDFHRLVLGHGSMPLEILERVVTDAVSDG